MARANAKRASKRQKDAYGLPWSRYAKDGGARDWPPLGGVLALAVCALLWGARSQDAVSQWGQDCGGEIRAALGLKGERGRSLA